MTLLTERHLREEVMNDMEVSDMVEEEVALPAQEVPVHRGGGTTGEAPRVVAVVRKHGIRVMKIGNHHEPVGDTQPRDAVVLDHFRESPDIA